MGCRGLRGRLGFGVRRCFQHTKVTRETGDVHEDEPYVRVGDYLTFDTKGPSRVVEGSSEDTRGGVDDGGMGLYGVTLCVGWILLLRQTSRGSWVVG